MFGQALLNATKASSPTWVFSVMGETLPDVTVVWCWLPGFHWRLRIVFLPVDSFLAHLWGSITRYVCECNKGCGTLWEERKSPAAAAAAAASERTAIGLSLPTSGIAKGYKNPHMQCTFFKTFPPHSFGKCFGFRSGRLAAPSSWNLLELVIFLNTWINIICYYCWLVDSWFTVTALAGFSFWVAVLEADRLSLLLYSSAGEIQVQTSNLVFDLLFLHVLRLVWLAATNVFIA